jgi:hypothetical protein
MLLKMFTTPSLHNIPLQDPFRSHRRDKRVGSGPGGMRGAAQTLAGPGPIFFPSS